MKVGHEIGSSPSKSAQEELEMISAQQPATWMLNKEKCLGHTPCYILETDVENGSYS